MISPAATFMWDRSTANVVVLPHTMRTTVTKNVSSRSTSLVLELSATNIKSFICFLKRLPLCLFHRRATEAEGLTDTLQSSRPAQGQGQPSRGIRFATKRGIKLLSLLWCTLRPVPHSPCTCTLYQSWVYEKRHAYFIGP